MERISRPSRSARPACRSTSREAATTGGISIRILRAGGTGSPLLPLIEEMNAAPSRLGVYTNYKTLTPISDYAYSYEQTYSTTLGLRRVCQPEPRMLRPQHHGIPPTDLELLHQGQERCGGHLSGSRRRRLRCKVCRLGGGYQLGRRQIQDRIHRTRGIQSLHELVRRVPGRFDRRQRTRLSDPVRPGIQPHQVKTRKTQPCET